MRTCLSLAVATLFLSSNAQAVLTLDPSAKLERLHSSDINVHGHMAGVRETADGYGCFIWTPLGGVKRVLSELNDCRIDHINDADEVVGTYSNNGVSRPFFWSEAQGIIEFPAIGELTVFSGFNNAREIAAWGGQSAGPNQYTFTFYGTPETGLAPVVTGYAVANGITESGVIAGHTMDASNQFHAFTWSAAGGLLLVPTPGASWTSMIEDAAIGVYDPDAMGGYVWKDGVLHAIDAVDSFPQGVSEDGHFVTGTSAAGAWRWTEENGLEPLISLPGDDAVSGTDVDSAGYVFGYGSDRDTPHRPHTMLWDAKGTPVNLSPDAYFAGGGLETCQEGEVRTFCTALYTPTCNYDFRTRIYSWHRESLEMVGMLKKAEESITALRLEGLISLRRLNNLLTYNLRPAQFKITTGKPYQMRSAATKLQQGLDKLKGWLGDDADHPVASAATWDILEVLESLKDTYLPPSCS